MGRLIAFALFIAVLVPGVLLARAWWLAAGQRAAASAGVELAEPTPRGWPSCAARRSTDGACAPSGGCSASP